MGKQCKECVRDAFMVFSYMDDVESAAEQKSWGTAASKFEYLQDIVEDLETEGCLTKDVTDRMKMELKDVAKAIEKNDSHLVGASVWRVGLTLASRGPDSIADLCQKEGK